MHRFAVALRQAVLHVLRHRLAKDWFVAKDRRHFFESGLQFCWHLDVDFCEPKPPVLPQTCEEAFEPLFHKRPIINFLPAERHFSQHRARIQCIGVIAQNFLTQFRIFVFLRMDSSNPGLLHSTEHQAWPSDNSAFEHFIRLWPRCIQLWGISLVLRAQ